MTGRKRVTVALIVKIRGIRPAGGQICLRTFRAGLARAKKLVTIGPVWAHRTVGRGRGTIGTAVRNPNCRILRRARRSRHVGTLRGAWGRARNRAADFGDVVCRAACGVGRETDGSKIKRARCHFDSPTATIGASHDICITRFKSRVLNGQSARGSVNAAPIITGGPTLQHNPTECESRGGKLKEPR